MTEKISPARGVRGVVSVPGDKSISHRYAMLTAIAEGDSHIRNFSTGADCHSTLACMRQLGVDSSFQDDGGTQTLTVHGGGLNSLKPATEILDAGNSGSTIRMLSGILAAQSFDTSITGDESLVKRPMKRIMAPLADMGASIQATGGQFPPLIIHGTRLQAITYKLPVASAQVKSCVLLAGLYAEGETIVEEPVATRDHTEIALRELGAEITLLPRMVKVTGGSPLKARDLFVPGDISSAAFFMVAALITADSDLIITGVGLNPTRTALLDVLRGMGAQIKLLHVEEANGELVGNLQVRSSRMKGGLIEGSLTAALIDEIPILSVLGALSEEGLTVRNASELRVKETDRIETIATNLRAMGVDVTTTEDGLQIPGRQCLKAAEIQSYGDHRIAMAFSIAALAANGPSEIQDAGAASVSFPEFYSTLQNISKSAA